MTSTVVDPAEEMKVHLQAARVIAAKADAEKREFTGEESAQLKELMGKASDAKARAEKAKGDAAVKAAMAQLGDEIGLDEKSGDKATPSGLLIPGTHVVICSSSCGKTPRCDIHPCS